MITDADVIVANPVLLRIGNLLRVILPAARLKSLTVDDEDSEKGTSPTAQGQPAGR
jgi:hypothetical protein